MNECPFLELPLPLYQPEEADNPRAKETYPTYEEGDDESNERVIIVQL